jgi:hypothetical protein
MEQLREAIRLSNARLENPERYVLMRMQWARFAIEGGCKEDMATLVEAGKHSDRCRGIRPPSLFARLRARWT